MPGGGPLSEAQFKTLKYRPDFPNTFGSIQDARAFCATFYRWYNKHHRHSGIAMHTPSDVHHGHAATVRDARSIVLTAAYDAPRTLRPQATRTAPAARGRLDQPA